MVLINTAANQIKVTPTQNVLTSPSLFHSLTSPPLLKSIDLWWLQATKWFALLPWKIDILYNKREHRKVTTRRYWPFNLTWRLERLLKLNDCQWFQMILHAFPQLRITLVDLGQFWWLCGLKLLQLTPYCQSLEVALDDLKKLQPISGDLVTATEFN